MDSSFFSADIQKGDKMPEPNNTSVPKGVKGAVKKVERLGVLDLLFAGDIKTAFQVAVKDVLGPKLQDILVNFSDTVIRSFIYGDNYRSSYDSRSNSGTFNNYRIISSGGQNQTGSYQTKPGDRYESITLVFEYYEDAKNAITFIQNSIVQYKVCSVLNVYDYTGQQTTPADDRYGWRSIGDIRPEKSRDGWVVRLPKPMEIEKG